MKRKLTEKKLVRIISSYTDMDANQINSNSMLKEDLGLSSFDLVCISAEVEEKYKIKRELLSANAPAPRTISDIMALFDAAKN